MSLDMLFTVTTIPIRHMPKGNSRLELELIPEQSWQGLSELPCLGIAFSGTLVWSYLWYSGWAFISHCVDICSEYSIKNGKLIPSDAYPNLGGHEISSG
ncbi:hypothetical protein BV898_02399 [Hypsibius exemplaris]|uniref:Uncharacterized protein n=1 Tax=Hypsibius exemplaris TaxID=2072580 RepID=A0A1W0X808_HYPEX|nr:hypothetical protein BV898_02399 [Hypsibius exemplaris]